MQKPGFYLVWREGSDGRTPCYKHHDYEAAKQEAVRLARVNGGKFHVLAQVAEAEHVSVKVTEMDLIPF